MGGRREVSIISHRPVTSSDLKHERLFYFCESVSTFLQLVEVFIRNYYMLGKISYTRTLGRSFGYLMEDLLCPRGSEIMRDMQETENSNHGADYGHPTSVFYHSA